MHVESEILQRCDYFCSSSLPLVHVLNCGCQIIVENEDRPLEKSIVIIFMLFFAVQNFIFTEIYINWTKLETNMQISMYISFAR